MVGGKRWDFTLHYTSHLHLFVCRVRAVFAYATCADRLFLGLV